GVGHPASGPPELSGSDCSGIVRVATYGCGLCELNRTASLGGDTRPITLTVHVIQVGEDSAPPPLTVHCRTDDSRATPRSRSRPGVQTGACDLHSSAARAFMPRWAELHRKSLARAVHCRRCQLLLRANAEKNTNHRISIPRPLEGLARPAASAALDGEI